MSKKRTQAERKANPRGPSWPAPATCPPELEGDGLLTWLRENASESVPSDAQLAAVKLIGADCIADVPYYAHGLHEQSLFTASVEDVRMYFNEHAPDAVFSEEGARLNGLCRRRAERHGFPITRWAMWGVHQARTMDEVRRAIGPCPLSPEQLRAVT